jgi:hypothetical protein
MTPTMTTESSRDSPNIQDVEQQATSKHPELLRLTLCHEELSYALVLDTLPEGVVVTHS